MTKFYNKFLVLFDITFEFNIIEYSINGIQRKKRIKVVPNLIAAGDPVGAQHYSLSYLQLDQSNFIEIHKPLDERLMWQDPYLTQWEGAGARKSLEDLNNRYNWQEKND